MTNAELLAMFKLQAGRPSTDELLTDAQIYGMLTRGQLAVNAELAIHVPHVNYAAPELMTTSDGGLTYTVASDAIGGMEVYPATTQEPLRPGLYWSDADFAQEGPRTIRMCQGRARTFSAGPYARYVKATGTIDGSTQPTLQPAEVHPAIVYEALIEYSQIPGVLADAGTWRDAKQQLLWGTNGVGGVIPALKTQYRTRGRSTGVWWSVFRV